MVIVLDSKTLRTARKLLLDLAAFQKLQKHYHTQQSNQKSYRKHLLTAHRQPGLSPCTPSPPRPGERGSQSCPFSHLHRPTLVSALAAWAAPSHAFTSPHLGEGHLHSPGWGSVCVPTWLLCRFFSSSPTSWTSLQGQTETAQVDLVPWAEPATTQSTAERTFPPSSQGFHPRSLGETPAPPTPLHSRVGFRRVVSGPGVPHSTQLPGRLCAASGLPAHSQLVLPPRLGPQPPDRFWSSPARPSRGQLPEGPVVQIQRFRQGSADQRAAGGQHARFSAARPRRQAGTERPVAQGGLRCPQVEASRWGPLPVTG